MQTAWEIDESDYPSSAPASERLRFLLRYAILAPSGHNSQPWLFSIRDKAVELHADILRSLPVVDPDNREMLISCGAALSFLRLAIHRFGQTACVTLFPDPHQPYLLARVASGGTLMSTDEEHRLFHAIAHRRTNRLAYEDKPVPPELAAALEKEAKAEGAWLHFVPMGTERERVGTMIAEGGRTLAANARFRRELASWMRPNWSRSRDGMPGFTFGWTPFQSLWTPWAVRLLDWGKSQGEAAKDLALAAPALAVLGTPDDTPLGWVQAGQALGRVLLRARVDGVWAHFLNQPVQVPALRNKLAEAMPVTGMPQLVFRMGFAQDIRPSPRRPVEDVLM